jgi:MoxR-like ATPase
MELGEISEKINLLRKNLERVILGKKDAIELSIATLLMKGHLLIEDVPGVGKTTLAQGLARSIAATFKRIQFTSDLMPSDVIGVTVYNEVAKEFEFRHGPIFANVVLADEINRSSPKTQSALLEAMSEGRVSVENITYRLPRPFFLLATQNPLEYAGTFPLPESQLDRFAMSISIGYPEESVEKDILRSKKIVLPENLSPVVTTDEILDLQEAVEAVSVEEDLVEYMVRMVAETRKRKDAKMGVSPRGAQALYRASRAMALINGRNYCIPDDIKRVAPAVLSHRIIPVRYGMEEPDRLVIIEEVLSSVKVPI